MKLKVLLLSNNEYGEGFNNLQGANRAMENIYNYLLKVVTQKEDILFLHDINYTESINSILEFVEKARQDPEAIFLFYFCGHGKITSGTNKLTDLVLAVKDTSAANYNSIGIKFGELLYNIKLSGINKYIVIIDSCCSGIINTMGKEDEIEIDKTIIGEGSVFISSVKGISSAYEIEINKKIVPCFSHYFFEAINILNQSSYQNYYSIENIFYKTEELIKSNPQTNMKPQISCRNKLSTEEIFPNIKVREEVFDDVLDVIDWRITSKCNNNCEICYAYNNLEDLDSENIETVIKKISSSQCRTICISGGEPTLSTNFKKIIKSLDEKGFTIFLSTNGYKFSNYKDDIEKYIKKLSLPLDGYDEKTNTLNGRNSDSFKEVTNILSYYNRNKHNFDIKVSTVLTDKTNNIDHLSKMLDLLKTFSINIWKIYEFIPGNKGKDNKEKYIMSRKDIMETERWIKENKDTVSFKIEFIKRSERDAAYFIIQPNGDVVIPKETRNSAYVSEKNIGNLIKDNFNSILAKWNSNINSTNYLRNTHIRKYRQQYSLEPIDKKILYYIISCNGIPSIKNLTSQLKGHKETDIEQHIERLYENRIIKNIIPVINLKMFGFKTFLATLHFKNNFDYPIGHIESCLSYNANIGWITQCENNIYRVAIFARNIGEASDILAKIKSNLNDDLEYEMHDLKCSYSIDDKILFINNKGLKQIPIQGSLYNTDNNDFSETTITADEFNVLRQIDSLRKPLVENLNQKMFVNSNVDVNTTIDSLKSKGVIKQLLTSIDTRLLGYEWYIISANVPINIVDDFLELLKKFENITHINHYIPQDSKCNLDFEAHVSSHSEVYVLLGNLEKQFPQVTFNKPLKIEKECKFSFLTHSVSDSIFKNFIEKET